MFNIFKQIPNKLFQIIFNNNSDNFNNSNNMETEIINLGHYQSKASIGSEKPDIIRIIGPSSKQENYWLTQDNKSIPSYELLENYIYLNTSPTKDKNKLPPLKIFAGIGEDTPEYDDNIQEEIIDNNIQEEIIDESNQIIEQKPKQIKIYKPKLSFDISVLEKITVDSLNKKSMDKFGINKFKKPLLDISLEIEFDYDIDKLRQTIELLDLNENEILDYIVENNFDISLIRFLLKQRIKEILYTNEQVKTTDYIQPKVFEKLVEEPELKQEPKEKPVEKIDITKIEKEEKLTTGINNIENYLKTIYG
jgi:hypothetical protein